MLCSLGAWPLIEQSNWSSDEGHRLLFSNRNSEKVSAVFLALRKATDMPTGPETYKLALALKRSDG